MQPVGIIGLVLLMLEISWFCYLMSRTCFRRPREPERFPSHCVLSKNTLFSNINCRRAKQPNTRPVFATRSGSALFLVVLIDYRCGTPAVKWDSRWSGLWVVVPVLVTCGVPLFSLLVVSFLDHLVSPFHFLLYLWWVWDFCCCVSAAVENYTSKSLWAHLRVWYFCESDLETQQTVIASEAGAIHSKYNSLL